MVCAVGVHAVVERLVDGDEPLRRVAEDHRRLGAPGMRVAVGQPAARDQRAGLDQLVDDGLVRRPSLPLASKTCRPAKKRHVRREGRVLQDVVGHPVQQAVLDERARSRRRRGEGAVCTKPVPASSVTRSPGQQRHIVVPVAARAATQRMGAGDAGKLVEARRRRGGRKRSTRACLITSVGQPVGERSVDRRAAPSCPSGASVTPRRGRS